MIHRYERWARRHLDIVLDSATNGEWYARCPYKQNHKHGDSTPSFGINVARGLYYCHGCGEKGNIEKLAGVLRVGIEEDPPDLDDLDKTIDALLNGYDDDSEVRRKPESWLDTFTSDMETVYGYWCDVRGIAEQVVDDFRLGFDKSKNAATIPIRDFYGHPLGVIRRSLDKNAKPRYRYPRGFKITEHLWGAHAVKGESTVAVVEGSVDALANWSVGIPSVALLGSRISDHQVHLLNKISPSEIVVMTDRDKAGRLASKRVEEAMSGCIVAVGRYKKSWRGKDPADLSEVERLFMFTHAS